MIKIDDLSKIYRKNIVLDKLNLQLDAGQVYCLLGKNGAGKTTLINSILDLVEPDGGNILIFGNRHNLLDKATKKRIGAVIEKLALIEEINGYEFLSLIGKIYEIQKDVLRKRIDDLFKYFFENELDLKKNISKYSTGMKKKIAFCAAVLHTPDLLILDEPFSGLDPLVANQMVMFLKKYQSTNRLIFISSHDLTYVEKVSTHIGVLDNAQLVFNSTLQDFTEN
jgi:ABC-2 type transport system ATP-binding protein